jgi:hypothetical protein
MLRRKEKRRMGIVKMKQWNSLKLAAAAWLLPIVMWGVFFLVGVLVAFATKSHIVVSGPVVYGILFLLFVGLHVAALVRGIIAFRTAYGKAGIAFSAASLLAVAVLPPMYFHVSV